MRHPDCKERRKIPLQNQVTKEILNFYMCQRCRQRCLKLLKLCVIIALPAEMPAKLTDAQGPTVAAPAPTIAAPAPTARRGRAKKGAAASAARGAAAAAAAGGAAGGSSDDDDEDEAAPAAPAAAPRRVAALGGAPLAPAAAAAAAGVAEVAEKENRKLFAPPPATRPACWASAAPAGGLMEADADVAAMLKAAEPAGTPAMVLCCSLRFASPLAAAPLAADLAAALEKLRRGTGDDFAPFRNALACSPVGAFIKTDTVNALWSGACIRLRMRTLPRVLLSNCSLDASPRAAVQKAGAAGQKRRALRLLAAFCVGVQLPPWLSAAAIGITGLHTRHLSFAVAAGLAALCYGHGASTTATLLEAAFSSAAPPGRAALAQALLAVPETLFGGKTNAATYDCLLRGLAEAQLDGGFLSMTERQAEMVAMRHRKGDTFLRSMLSAVIKGKETLTDCVVQHLSHCADTIPETVLARWDVTLAEEFFDGLASSCKHKPLTGREQAALEAKAREKAVETGGLGMAVVAGAIEVARTALVDTLPPDSAAAAAAAAARRAADESVIAAELATVALASGLSQPGASSARLHAHSLGARLVPRVMYTPAPLLTHLCRLKAAQGHPPALPLCALCRQHALRRGARRGGSRGGRGRRHSAGAP